MPSSNSSGLHANSLRKSFTGVFALDRVSLTLTSGEIHGLCGENGAGKSTLIRILGGVLHPDAGSVTLDGAPLHMGSVPRAEAAGIIVIHQDPLAFPDLSAEDSIFVGHEPSRLGGLWLDRAKIRRAAREQLAQLGERFDPRRRVADLPLAQQQMVAIARALSRRCRYLILDEPTASLSARETRVLLDIVRKLASSGVGIFYVSHRLEEIFEICSQVTVLRDGRLVAAQPTASLTRNDLIRQMVGREMDVTRRDRSVGPPWPTPNVPTVSTRTPSATGGRHYDAALDVRNLTRGGAFQDISFSIQPGEILGLAGLVGAGRSEIARCIAGVDHWSSGSVHIHGRAMCGGSVREALDAGLVLVPEDRRLQGLILPMSISTNLTLAILRSLCRRGFVSRDKERPIVERFIRDLSIRTSRASGDLAAATLSGGNQQKVLLGKWLAASPRILILDEPTRGVDVGAKSEIHALIQRLAADGLAVLLISSDLPEILELSDRALVLRSGRIAGELSRQQATAESVMALAVPLESELPATAGASA